MKTAIKICGLQTAEDCASLQHKPVQYAGFVLAPSKRKISINILCKLVPCLPHSITPVAVTVNAPTAEIGSIVEMAGVTHIQLHGDEDAAHCVRLRQQLSPHIRLIKALPARGEKTLEQIACYAGVVDAVLLDTYQPHQRGGSGKTFQWHDIPAYQAACRRAGVPLWIAGGLNPDNVQQLIEQYSPDGVDVSSGVERDGIKSADLIEQFVKRVRTV